MNRLSFYLIAVVFMAVFCGSSAFAQENPPGKSHCSDKTLYCVKDKGRGESVGHVKMGQCWYWFPPGCADCEGADYAKYAIECNERYASECKDGCWACDTEHSGGSGLKECYDRDGHGHVADVKNIDSQLVFCGF